MVPMRNFSIIVATDAKRGIGKSGKLPWQLSGDMKYFRTLTSKAAAGKTNAVIMGRTTWESIPEKFRPLPQRLNVVLTRRTDLTFPPGVLSGVDFPQAFDLIERSSLKSPIDKIFVIGGAKVYQTALSYRECEALYVTEIDQIFACDTFFPDVRPDFELNQSGEPRQEGAVSYAFCTYLRKAT